MEEAKVDDDGDVLMNDLSPPKKKPAGIGQRPAKKKKAPAADTAEENEKKPAAEAAPAPKKANPGSTKGPVAPIIADDNLGAGMDTDQAIEIVAANFSSGTVKAFESAKWQEKVAGFEGLQNEIRENQPEAEVLEAVAKFIKSKMKDWKESNINL